MKKITCAVQEHHFNSDQIKAIERGVKDIYALNYKSNEKILVTFMVLPKTYAYAERMLSQAVLIMVEVEQDITSTKRIELMTLLSKFMLDNFNVSPLDLVITVANSSYVNQFFDAQQTRMQASKRPLMNLKIAAKAIVSRIKNGYWTLSARV